MFPAFFKSLIPVIMEPTVAQLRPGDFRETLRTLLIDRITVAVDHPALFVMVWRELLMRPAFRSAFEAVFVQRVLPAAKAFFANAKRRGELRNLSPDLVLRTIMGHLAPTS